MTLQAAIATLFGVGRAPVAPGTAASLVALPLAWLISGLGGPFVLLAATVLATAAGMWACERYIQGGNDDDPPECVVDELVGQWLACAFAPRTLLLYAIAFIAFRAFDIAKPWPVSVAERLKGGVGVMADDVVAGLLASLIVAACVLAGVV